MSIQVKNMERASMLEFDEIYRILLKENGPRKWWPTKTSNKKFEISIGAILSGLTPLEASIKGRDLISGLPREVVITDSDIREAISQSIDTLIESVKEVLEITPPEILSDIMQRGIYLIGGGALIKGLAEIITEYTKIPVHIAGDPLTAVCRGTGIILENLELYKDVLIANEDELPPKK